MANPIKIYKTLEEAYNALLKGFRSIKNRDPDIVENQMLKAEAEGKIKSQGDNISIFPEDKPEGIMSQAPGIKSGEVVEAVFKPGMDKRGKMVKESPSQRQADLDRPFVTEDEMSAFTLEDNARKLNKAKGFIDKLGAKTTKQKLFIADLVEDAGTGVFQDVDMGAVVRSNMFDDLIEQGIDDDLLTNIMYSGTKSDDFATTLAKIKSNARDEGVDIDETVDFYERVFDEVGRVKKAMGGRIGYAVGSLPKGIQKLVQALNKKFGKGTMKTADEMDRPKDVQAFEDFETRNPNPKRQLTDDEIKFYEEELGDSETWMNDGTVGEAEKALKDLQSFVTSLLPQLNEYDFETLVEMLFLSQGYQKIAKSSGAEKSYDLALDRPWDRIDGDKPTLPTFVQIKAAPKVKDIEEVYEDFVKDKAFKNYHKKGFLVSHSVDDSVGKKFEKNKYKGENIVPKKDLYLIGPVEIAKQCIDFGKVGWLLEKVI